jgi:ABC-type multidrug transport system fused ATPase/permease subunit
MWIVQRSTTGTAGKRTMQLLVGVLVCCAIGAADLLMLYAVWGSYPFAPVPATIAAGIALYLVLRTDLLRPRGVDRGVGLELVAFAFAGLASLGLALALRGGSVAALAALASLVWVIATGGAWALSRSRPMRVVGERALEQFAARATLQVDERELAARLASLWQKTIGVTTQMAWTRAGDELVEIGGTRRFALDADLARWLARHAEPIARADLATMRLGPLRARLEAFVSQRGHNMVVSLVDRGELVGLIDASYERSLREDERALVAASARAAASGLVFAALARDAERERETQREVEIAETLRLHAQADSERIRRWSVAVERHGARALRAGWSAIETGNGRLALLVIEAGEETSNIAAALALAAAIGAFAAALAGRSEITLVELLAALRAGEQSIDQTSDGGRSTAAGAIVHGGIALAAFVAFLDEAHDRIEWACAGHRGGELVDAEHLDGERTQLAASGAHAMPATAILVVASARGDAPALELTVRRRPS